MTTTVTGIVATLLLAIAAMYAVRRRFMRFFTRMKIGTARRWLDLHLVLGVLFLVAVLLHSRFTWPQGPLTVWIFLLSWWTVASGLLGLALQRSIPRILASGLQMEVSFERIPELVVEMREQAEALVKTCGEELVNLYERHLAAGFAAPHARLVYFADVTGGIRSRLRELEYLRRFMNAEEVEKLDRLEDLVRKKVEIDAHYTLQKALRFWLVLHVPTSLVLAALVVVHILTVIYY